MKLTGILVAVLLLSGCVRQNYFLSPFQANSNTYHVTPLKSDHVRSASYLHGGIAFGGADDYRDDVFAFTSEYYKAHSFGSFEAYYGADLSLGYYNVINKLYSYNGRDSSIVATINAMSGKKIFGGYGIKGGIALVVPFLRRGGEWRIIGIETSMQNEFGQYLKFRRKLPDSVATANMNASFFPTIGITTEAVARLKHSALSYKLNFGTCFRNENINYNRNVTSFGPAPESPLYFSQTVNYTRDRGWSIYYQGTFASHAAFFQLGFVKQLKSIPPMSKGGLISR